MHKTVHLPHANGLSLLFSRIIVRFHTFALLRKFVTNAIHISDWVCICYNQHTIISPKSHKLGLQITYSVFHHFVHNEQVMINARQLADTNKNTTRMAHNSINRNAEAEHNNKATLHSVDSYGSRLEMRQPIPQLLNSHGIAWEWVEFNYAPLKTI